MLVDIFCIFCIVTFQRINFILVTLNCIAYIVLQLCNKINVRL